MGGGGTQVEQKLAALASSRFQSSRQSTSYSARGRGVRVSAGAYADEGVRWQKPWSLVDTVESEARGTRGGGQGWLRKVAGEAGAGERGGAARSTRRLGWRHRHGGVGGTGGSRGRPCEVAGEAGAGSSVCVRVCTVCDREKGRRQQGQNCIFKPSQLD